MESRKIAHLHLKDYIGNKYTLICRVSEEGSISYVHFGGWNSSGTPHSLSNLQCTLPVYPEPNETEGMFVDRIVNVVNKDSVKYVDKRVPVKVVFA